jgi:DNA polymerase-3 subunit delta'
MERSNKLRAKRRRLDMVDRGLMDLVSVYRDAIAYSFDPNAALVNEELRQEIVEIASHATAAVNVRRIDAIFAAREQLLEFNVPVPLALEAMMVALWQEQRG